MSEDRTSGTTAPQSLAAEPTPAAVYDVLVETCEAHENESMRMQFDAFWRRRESAREFRFMGALGFGGKLWWHRSEPPTVSCYPEDSNQDRRDVIDATNAALRQLYTATAQAVAPKDSDGPAPKPERKEADG